MLSGCQSWHWKWDSLPPLFILSDWKSVMESTGDQTLWLQKNTEHLGNLYPKFCARVQQECGCPMRGHQPEAGVTQHNLCPPQSGWVLGGQSRVLVMGSSNSSQHRGDEPGPGSLRELETRLQWGSSPSGNGLGVGVPGHGSWCSPVG